MAYSDFSLREVVETFDLKLTHAADLFAGAPDVPPGPILDAVLPEFLPLALMGNEKARSELLITPILVTVRVHLKHQVGIFSGQDFDVDPAQGLSGRCDYLLTRSPVMDYLCSPVAAVVEAKWEDLASGLGQCAAALVAARLFNENEGKAGLPVHGAVSSGTSWRFVRLAGHELTLGDRESHINELPRLLGALVRMVGG
ncbi:MAG: hypothetical protein ACRC33_21520 [Gemmataceae bacterium]